MRYLPLTFFLLLGCATTSHVDRVSRDQAIAFLQSEGIIHGSAKVESAVWHEDLKKWLITVGYPHQDQKEVLAWWFVDADGKNYSGGTCRH